MNEQSEHLSNAQIENYGNRTSGAGSDANQPDEALRINAHLESCPSCRSHLLDFHRASFGLLADPQQLADVQVNTVSTPECPSDDALRQLAAGLTPDALATKLTQHIATCDHCGPLLRAFTEDFSDDFSPEEQVVLNNLRSSAVAWQKNTAREMLKRAIPSPPSPRPIFAWKWIMIPATAAACSVIAVSIWYTQRDTPEKVEALMAQAYTEQRTMEMRWPGAAWGPVRTTRGPEDSRFAKPPALLKAEGKISERASAKANDGEWLRAKAQADILERNPEAAIASLSQALEARPGSVSLMLDLSTAYYQQGEISLDPQNYEKSADLLGEVLQKDPENLTALFNRALLNEQMKMVDSAIADWELFLKKERDPGWADDARKRLSALQELKHKKSSHSPPVTVEQWTTALGSDNPTAAEEALDAAVTEWLPKAYPAHPSLDKSESEYARLLVLAAKKLQSQHRDSWLADLLRFTGSPHFEQGISELQTATHLNSQGKASDAVVSAGKAQAAFRQDHNLPGIARAQLEEVYAYQRSGKGSPCLERAAKSRSGIENRAYLWLKTQLLLDEASCFNIQDRLEEAKLDAEDALAQNSVPARYKILQLRVLGIAAALATTRGDAAFAVKQDLTGLQEYWAGQYPIIRAYQFCSDLSFNTEAAGLWHLTYAADKEAVWAISQTPNTQVEALARYRLAKAAVMVGERQVAETEMQQADRIFAHLPKTESTLIAQIDGAIGVIRSHIDLGQNDFALDRFKQINVPPDFMESRLIARRMDQVRGDIELKLGHLNEAQEAYLAAVSIAESSLSTLHDDRARSTWSWENGPSYRALANIAMRQSAPVKALEIWERYRAAPVRFSKSGSPNNKDAHLVLADFDRPDIVREARPELRGEMQITYAFLPDGLLIWVMDDSELDFKFASMKTGEIRRMARQFTQQCKNPRSDLNALRRNANALFVALIRPINRHLKPGSILNIETDGELDGIPFSALVDDSGRYFGETFAITVSPGLAFIQYLRNPKFIQSQDRVLAIGDPALSKKWRGLLPPLASANMEARMVATKFNRSRVLLGKDASLARIEEQISYSSVVHFAGHSLLTNSGPWLVLAPERENTAETFLFLPGTPLKEFAEVDLVVLSACSTGVSGSNADSPLLSLLNARVPQVISTGWLVDSGSTLVFMTTFYDQLVQGKSTALALQAAAGSVRQIAPYQHPFYWAPFRLTGKNSRRD